MENRSKLNMIFHPFPLYLMFILLSGVFTHSTATAAAHVNRTHWAYDPDRNIASIIAEFGYQKMGVMRAEQGDARVVFTHINDQGYCGGQDALFNPIAAKIDLELEIDKQLEAIALSANIGCHKGMSYVMIDEDESVQLMAMMNEAQRIKFDHQSYSLNGFKHSSAKVLD